MTTRLMDKPASTRLSAGPSTSLRTGFDPAQDRLRFLLVLHNHQPLGNFDGVIQRLMDKAYRPFLEAIRDRPALKLTLHVSGPLLLWLERQASDYLDLVGELVQRGQVELLMGGLYEPI
ncbi:MAG: putative 4-alpha-glucanotransferase (Amylomaltase) (Disproportionating enzyme) (D-enzyme), partial [candidate division NC10 bacterium]|nr:putative 4-alpha-glucanotransferase (Amylomaltase) (Disproportionating enzyme) (D-enzyme) [candidate division NC10 bacterium]